MSWSKLDGNLYKSKNPKPFILVPLIDLIANKTAELIWGSCVKSESLPILVRCGSTPFAAYRIISKSTDAYISTGDVIVPYTNPELFTNNTALARWDAQKDGPYNKWEAPHLQNVVKQLNIQVLFVINDRTYCEIIDASNWKQRFNDAGSKNPKNLNFFAVGNRDRYNGNVVLGDAVENSGAFDSSRVIAAVKVNYVALDEDSVGSKQPANFIADNANMGWSNGLNWIARSTPYANFKFCAGGCADWGYSLNDVIPAEFIDGCCLFPSLDKHCGPYKHNTSDPTKSACPAYMSTKCATTLDAACKTYFAPFPGKFDNVVKPGCALPENAKDPFCACLVPAVFDKSVPEWVQKVYASNPKCVNPECANSNAYKTVSMQNDCMINIQSCVTSNNLTSGGEIAKNVTVNQSTDCKQQLASSEAKLPAENKPIKPIDNGSTKPNDDIKNNNNSTTSSWTSGWTIGLILVGILGLFIMWYFIYATSGNTGNTMSNYPVYMYPTVPRAYINSANKHDKKYKNNQNLK